MVIQFSTLKVWSKKRWRTPKTARHQKEENVIVSRKIFPRARRGQPGRSASEANLLAAEVGDDDDDDDGDDDDDVMKMMVLVVMTPKMMVTMMMVIR